MDEFKDKIRNLFFPPAFTCSFCGREVFGGKTVCEECEKTLPYNSGSICEKCGRKTLNPVSYCDNCAGKELHFDIARSAYVYKPPISQAIQRLKYENSRYLAREFAKEMAKTYYKTFMVCDGIVCVPMTERHRKKRGYNQSALIAVALSEELDLPFFEDVIQKKRETKSQVGLTQKERIINLSGSFSIKNRSMIEGKRLILTDDVLTTGTTAEFISEKLVNAGAASVFVLTVSSVDFKSKNKNAENQIFT